MFQVANYVAGTISNYTIKFEKVFFEKDGLLHLLNALDYHDCRNRTHELKGFISEVLDAIRHLINIRIENSEKRFINLKGLPRIQYWLQGLPNNPNNFSTVPRKCLKSALAIVRQLSAFIEVQNILRKEEFVHQIIRIFIYFFDEIELNGNVDNGDNVKAMEILDQCNLCIIQFLLSYVQDNRKIMCDKVIVNIFKNILMKKDKFPSVQQKHACRILSLLAIEPEGAFAVLECDPQIILEHLANPQNQNAQDEQIKMIGKLLL